MPAANPDKLAFYLLKAVSKANRVYRLLDAGDRIAVAVSGGKDSATLLELLRQLEKKNRRVKRTLLNAVERQGAVI